VLLKDENFSSPTQNFPVQTGHAEQITTVEWPTPNHLYWPLLDVDLAVNLFATPANFPWLRNSTVIPAGCAKAAQCLLRN